MIDSLRECPQCGSPVEGRPNKKFCSDSCKGRYFRENSEPEEERSEYFDNTPPEQGYSNEIQPSQPSIKSMVMDAWERSERKEKERRDKLEAERKARINVEESEKIHQQFCVLVKEFLDAEGKTMKEQPVAAFLGQVDDLTDSYRKHPYLKLPGNQIQRRLHELYHIQDIIRELIEDIKTSKWSQKGQFELTGKWRKTLRGLLIED